MGEDATEGVVVSDLVVARGGEKLFPAVSFSLQRGEFCGVVGANGVGKTSLIRTVIGLESSYRGTISLGGRDIRGISCQERADWFAYLPQRRDGFVTGLRVRQVVESGLIRMVKGIGGLGARHREAVQRAIARTGIEQLSDRPFDELSGGEQQRVLIASALAQGARYLVLDEPTTFLDQTTAHSIMQLLRDISVNERGGVWMACHDLSLLLSYGSRVIALSREKGMFCGSPSAFLSSGLLASLYGQPLRVIPDPLDRFLCIVPR